MRAQPGGAKAFLQVPSLIRRRNLGSGQTSFGFLALLPWRAQRLSGCESTEEGVARQGIAAVYRDATIRR
ncbi:hypothetical protein ASC92_18705 [Variovorax sp. Root411]|nr:hypothetical protein ASC92_18705 [Variovorax sp. Root411]